ncbi:MAG: putative membrane protein [Candidatus Azotimanducaceae bacterium]|jgi:putative membrane protein
MAILTESEIQQVAAAIDKVEQSTDAELVTVLAHQADDYHYIPTLWAALLAMVSPGIILLTPFWLGVSELLVLQASVFIIFAVVLRLPFVLRHIIPKRVKVWRASNLARRQFLDNNLHHTAGDSGLLIFVSETEHYVEIIADRGISKVVDNEVFEAIVAEFTQKVKNGQTLNGFLYAVEACGELLTEHVPATGQKNELPNRMILL